MKSELAAIVELFADAIAERLAEKTRKAETSTASVEKMLWSEAEVAALIGVSVCFLKRARLDGHIAAQTRARPILYSREDISKIKKWLAQRT